MNQQNKLTRRELNKVAREQKIPYYYHYTKHDLMMKLGMEQDKTTKFSPNVSRADLLNYFMAKERGIKNFDRISKYDLAEILGIQLPRPKRNQLNGKACRKPRSVEVWNPDGTTTTYPSISRTVEALRIPPMQIYKLHNVKISGH